MKQFITISLLFLSTLLYAQNLVLNPSFEDHSTYKCLVYMGGFNNDILNWSIPNYGSTDFFDTCSKDMGRKNYNGIQKPKSGTSYAGMYYYTDKNYREYVQGQLLKTLSAGKRYKMIFYLSLADKSSYALKDIEVLITEEKLEPCHHSNNCEKTIKPSKATKKNFKMYSDSDEKYFSDKESWMAYTFEFTAEGYENYFSIGNFYRNPKTKKQKTVSDSPYFFSYYYIDDVSIEAVEKEQKEQKEEVIEVFDEPEIKINEVYTFKDVLFDFDKAGLLDISIEELTTLYTYLSQKTNLKIEIYGHTDTIGLAKRNQELSEQRAKAVADYLVSLGLDSSKVKSFGFGSSKPVADNETDEGRQLNRRVEFKLKSI